MPILDKLEKNKHLPISLIFKGACELGVELSTQLIEQGGFVVVVDEYTQNKKKKVNKLLKNDLFHFVDLSGIESLVESLKKLDYIFYLNSEIGKAEDEVSTSEFLQNSNNLDRLLRIGVEKESKFLLTSSINLHRRLQNKKDSPEEFDLDDEGLSYTVLEVHRYAENLTWEYYKKGGLNARIVRIGELLGEGIDLNKDSEVFKYIKDAISGKKLEIQGDGLENLYFVHKLDASYGLIKAMFTDKTSGEIYSLNIPRDITVLNLAYKIQDLEPRAGGIDFVDEEETKAQINIYKPAKNLKEIGWKPKVSFERALAQTIDYAYDFFGKTRKQKKRVSKEEKPQKSSKKSKSKKSIKDRVVDFFFETKEEEKQKSVLDSLKYKANQKSVLKDKGKNGDRVYLTNKSEKKDTKGKKGKKAKKESTFFRNLSWNISKNVNKIKNSIASLSLLKVASYFVFVLFLILVYIFGFVPIIRIGFYGFKASQNIQKATVSMQSLEYSGAKTQLEDADANLDKVVSSFDMFFYLSGFKFYEYINSFKNDVVGTKFFVEELKAQSEYAQPIENYLEDRTSNVVLDGQDGLQASSREGFDELDNILSFDEARCEGLQFGENYENIFLVGNQFKKLDENFLSLEKSCEQTNSLMSIFNVVFGVEQEDTWAILLLDESKMMPRGGEIVASTILTVEDGVVKKIDTYSASEVELNFDSQQISYLKSDLGVLYPEEKIGFKDLSLISDEYTFSMLIKDSLENKFETQPDHIVTLNYNTLEDLIKMVGGVQMVESEQINSTNFSDKREEAAPKELLSKTLKKFFDFKKADVGSIAILLKENIEEKDITVYSNSESLDKVVTLQSTETDNGFEIYFANVEGNIANIDVQTRSEYEDEKISSEFVIVLSKDTDQLSGQMVVQMAPEYSISSSDAKQGATLLDDSKDKLYYKLELTDNESAEFVFEATSDKVVKKEENSYNYIVKYSSFQGLDYNLEFIFDYGEDFVLQSSPQNSSEVDTTVKIEEKITEDKEFTFTFSSDK